MSFSELKNLESEVIRLEKAHSKASDAAVRSGIAAKILEHCKRIGDLEKRAFISYKVKIEELIPRYQASAGTPPPPPAPAAPPLPSAPPAPLATAPLPPPPPPASARPAEPTLPAPAPLAPPPAPVVITPPAPKTSITPILAPVDVSLLAAKVEALGKQPFSPDAYPSRKQQYERLIQEIVSAKASSGSEGPFVSVLAKLWEYSIREDDAFEDYRKLNPA